MKPAPTIGIVEMLAALEKSSGEPDGVTMREIVRALGLKENHSGLGCARDRIRPLVEAGAIAVSFTVKPDMTGRPSRVPVYRVVKGRK